MKGITCEEITQQEIQVHNITEHKYLQATISEITQAIKEQASTHNKLTAKSISLHII